MGHDSFIEGGKVGGFETLGGDDVGDCGEADVVGFRVGADEPEPLFSDDEGDEEVGVFGRE